MAFALCRKRKRKPPSHEIHDVSARIATRETRQFRNNTLLNVGQQILQKVLFCSSVVQTKISSSSTVLAPMVSPPFLKGAAQFGGFLVIRRLNSSSNSAHPIHNGILAGIPVLNSEPLKMDAERAKQVLSQRLLRWKKREKAKSKDEEVKAESPFVPHCSRRHRQVPGFGLSLQTRPSLGHWLWRWTSVGGGC